jgi:hypothetical protein
MKLGSLILRERHNLRVFVKRVLRIYGPKMKEVPEFSRKLYNEKVNNCYPSENNNSMIKEDVMDRHVAHIRKMRNAHIFIGQPEGKRPLGRYWRRQEDNNKMDFQEIGHGMDHLA